MIAFRVYAFVIAYYKINDSAVLDAFFALLCVKKITAENRGVLR